jgi:replicative superfamily II helicase
MDNLNQIITQQDREKVIIKLDESTKYVKLEDLFLYDLSPYFKEKIDDSFFSKQLEFIQEKNKSNHDKKISFTEEQIKVYYEIVQSKRCIVSAPTSFGKTMLVKEYIYNYQPKFVVFIVPTNSLADELLDDFIRLYEKFGYTIFDSIKKDDIIKEKSIFIGTQEKYKNLIDQYENQIDLFVIDEAYKLTDPIKSSREVILNRSFIDSINRTKKTILLMPLVNSINGLESLKFKIIRTDYSPVAKKFFKEENIIKRFLEQIQYGNTNTLAYFSQRSYAESFYSKNLNHLTIKENINSEWIRRVETDFHPEWIPINALKRGVGIHYGPMPKFIQKKVANLFKSSQIKILLSTSSIIEGVNTPTKNIFIINYKDILGSENLVKFKNLIGRAGRLGEHKIGNIYYNNKDKKLFEEANVPYNDINIKFTIDNQNEIIEINRIEDINTSNEVDSNDNSKEDKKTFPKEYLEHPKYKNVPIEEVSKLIDKHGFTVNKYIKLLNYTKSEQKYFITIIGLMIGSIDSDFRSVVLSSKYKTFTSMVEEISKKKGKTKKSDIISSLIEMIYNTYPFKIIPLINFTNDIDNLYRRYNNEFLMSNDLTKDANKMKARFYSKFIGEIKENDEVFIIVNKLFEYGIPLNRVKPYIEEITQNLPDKFSIHDIKRIIFQNDEMKDLRIYFE